MAVGAILGQRGIQSVNGVPSGVTGNVDLSAGNMTSGIDMNSQTLTGLTTPINNNDATSKKYVDDNINLASTTGLEAIRAAAPYNWLDNSDFTNLVAQAGIGENHGSQAYAADRWILNSGSVSYNAGTGLTLNGTITQKLEFKPTGTTSAFVGMQSGSASINYNNAEGTVTITSSGGVIAWAALYEGTYTEQTKPIYCPKGYELELMTCLRYYYDIPAVFSAGYVTAAAKNYTMPIQLPAPMRVVPTVLGNPKWYARTYNGYANAHGGSAQPFENLSVGGSISKDTTRLTLVDSVSEAVDVNNSIMVFAISNLILSADL